MERFFQTLGVTLGYKQSYPIPYIPLQFMCYLSNVENRSPVFYHALRCGRFSAASTFYDDFEAPDYTTLKELDNKDLSFKRSRTSQLSDPVGSCSLTSKIISPQLKEVLNMLMFEFYAKLVRHPHKIVHYKRSLVMHSPV